MATLLMRLCAPMQSWGYQSHFAHRDTGREPTKSSVIGLLCAALGRPRSESLNDLNELWMAVRVDCEGTVRRDYHTAGMGGVYKVSGGLRKDLIPSDRYYLHDAKFLVGLEHEDINFLHYLQQNLQRPTWFLYLGRKACIPSERVWLPDGVKDVPLREALESQDWLGMSNPPQKVRGVIEDKDGSIRITDKVLSFEDRHFLPRYVSATQFSLPQKSQEE
jgi:CRISPR system Cascade subunit CasD